MVSVVANVVCLSQNEGRYRCHICQSMILSIRFNHFWGQLMILAVDHQKMHGLWNPINRMVTYFLFQPTGNKGNIKN